MSDGIGAVFGRIYRERRWGDGESLSGPGSGLAAARRAGQVLVEEVDRLRALHVLDVGCGDGLWQPDLGATGYLGVDVAAEAIERARERHPERQYRVLDVAAQGAPAVGPWGLILCRDAMQHLPLATGRALLDRLLEARPGALLLSTYLDGENVDVPAGGAYRPNLYAPPFSMPPAQRLYHDGWDYDTGTALRDPGKLLGLWRL